MTYNLEESPKHKKLITEFNYWLSVATAGRIDEHEQALKEMARVQESICRLIEQEGGV